MGWRDSRAFGEIRLEQGVSRVADEQEHGGEGDQGVKGDRERIHAGGGIQKRRQEKWYRGPSAPDVMGCCMTPWSTTILRNHGSPSGRTPLK